MRAWKSIIAEAAEIIGWVGKFAAGVVCVGILLGLVIRVAVSAFRMSDHWSLAYIGLLVLWFILARVAKAANGATKP